MAMTFFLTTSLFLAAIILIGFVLVLSSGTLIWKLIVNSLVGLISLLLVNYFAARYGIVVPINLFTVVVAGFLGIPGILGLIFWQVWM
jgi:inhibitor of the pro-sigma K processing machinery